VLCNTVKSAQEVFQVLKANVNEGTKLFLFHARFRAGERGTIEKEIIARFGKDAGDDRPERAIVVATQVVEQSLDVDFDYFISQVAPIDLLLQRSGRLHRHDPKTRSADAPPVLHVLLPAAGELVFGATEKVYAPEILLRTVAYLEKDAVWELPQDFRRLIEGVYDRKPLPNDIIPAEKLAEAESLRKAKQQLERGKAKDNLLPRPSARQFSMVKPAKLEADGDNEAHRYFRASTRLGDDSLAVLVLHEADLIAAVQSCRAHDPQARGPQYKVLEALFLQKVGLPKWWFRGVEMQGEEATFFEAQNWLRGHHVLVMRDREWKGRDFVIRDDAELGLQRIVSESDIAAAERTEADAGMTN
jgi:CRISPR-associated endonuclease/helicase Cas3